MKYLDIFGVQFNFTTNKKLTYSTSLGGFITILCLSCIIVISILFGRDFIYKKNPRIYQQNVIPKYYPEPIKLDPENFVFPWRLMDFNGNNLDISGRIYPSINHQRRITNSSGIFTTSLNKLELSKCNLNNSKMSEFNENFNISNYNCFDWTKNNYTFGGYLDGNYTDHFEFYFSLCPNNYYYTKDGNCTSFKDFFMFLTSSDMLYLEILYPEVYLVPDDIVNPLKITFKSHFFAFGPNIARIDRIFISKTSLYDDLGWVLEEKNEIDKYGVIKIQTDLGFYDPSYLEVDYSQATFYSCYFYMTKNYTVFNRSFMKLQDLSASVGGFMKTFLILAHILTKFYNKKARNNFIYNEFFNYVQFDKRYIIQNNPKTLSQRQMLSQNQINFDNLNILNINKNQLMKEIKTSQKIDFGFCFLIKKFSKVKKIEKYLKLYNFLVNYFSEKLDLLNYLKHLQNFDNLKKILLNDSQSLAINFISSPKIYYNKDEIMYNYTEEINQVNMNRLKNYFHVKLNSNYLSEIDKKLIELIYPELIQKSTRDNETI